MAITFCTLLPLPTEAIKLASDKWEDLVGPTVYYACELKPGYLGIITYKFDYLRALSVHNPSHNGSRKYENCDYQYLPVPVVYRIADLKNKLWEHFRELDVTYLAMDRCHDLIDQMCQGLFYDSRYVLPDLVTPHINLPFLEWLNCLSMPEALRRPEFEELLGSKKPAKMQDDGLVGDASSIGSFDVDDIDDLKDIHIAEKENTAPFTHLDWDVANVMPDSSDTNEIDNLFQDPVSVIDQIDGYEIII